MYNEWVHPYDKTEIVRQLARSGYLRTLQLINRGLPALPDKLQRCTNLKHMYVSFTLPQRSDLVILRAHVLFVWRRELIYADTNALPDWTAKFMQLEYLHIEGKLGGSNFVYLPDDLFSSMHALEYIHLCVHPFLPKLPSFHGLTNAKSILLALMFAINELLSFESLARLEQLDVVYLAALRRLPELVLLVSLRKLTLVEPNAFCCNGFLGVCNLSHVFCTEGARRYIPKMSCLDEKQSASSLTNTSQRLLHTTGGSICPNKSNLQPNTMLRADVDICGDVPFRQCRQQPLNFENDSENASSAPAIDICANARMQVLACSSNPREVEIQKLQICHGIGPKCTPDIEA